MIEKVMESKLRKLKGLPSLEYFDLINASILSIQDSGIISVATDQDDSLSNSMGIIQDSVFKFKGGMDALEENPTIDNIENNTTDPKIQYGYSPGVIQYNETIPSKELAEEILNEAHSMFGSVVSLHPGWGITEFTNDNKNLEKESLIKMAPETSLEMCVADVKETKEKSKKLIPKFDPTQWINDKIKTFSIYSTNEFEKKYNFF